MDQHFGKKTPHDFASKVKDFGVNMEIHEAITGDHGYVQSDIFYGTPPL